MGDRIADRSADVEILGPATWNQLVYLDRLPEPRPQMVFAGDCWQALGGTSAGKALHLAARGRSHHLHTVVGDDEPGARILAALAAGSVSVDATTCSGRSERHLNLMTARGERLSIGLSAPGAGRAGDLFDHVADATLDGAEPPEALRAGAEQAATALGSRHLSPTLEPGA